MEAILGRLSIPLIAISLVLLVGHQIFLTLKSDKEGSQDDAGGDHDRPRDS